MPIFDYQAVNGAGERVTGSIHGTSMEQALQALSISGVKVERIHESELEPPPARAAERSEPQTPPIGPPTEQRSYMATSVVGALAGGVPLASLTMFYRQFSTMLEAGVPIVQALDTLSRQGHNMKLHQVVQEIRGHVEAGRAISAGMQRYPEVFAPLTLSLVRAGEEGGFLAQSFKLLADYTDQEIAQKNLIRRLTIYPKIVLISSIVIIAAANGIIHMLGKESNLLSSPLTEWQTWVILGPLLIGAFLVYKLGLANPRGKHNWDAITVNMPFGIGRTVHEFAMSKFGLALSYLYKGGVPVQNAVKLAADACGNEYLRSKIAPAGRRLESGAGISETLRNTEAFSPIVMDMVDTGERTGNMDQMLMRMSSFYEDEAKTRAQQLAHIFSTILYLLVAVYVCYVVITFYMKLVGSYGAAAGD